MRQVIIGLFLCIAISSSAQINPSHTRISIITCGPGEDLYSLFGHTAIRVTDTVNHIDIVYNWGGFTFDQPYFYIKFMRGKLLYYSLADYYPDFMEEYAEEHRSVYEQVLNLDSAAKLGVINAINHNMEGENKFYKYDFLLDNCTTRVKNILFENNTVKITNNIVPDKTTSRDLIHYYLDRGSEPWTKLGIDILLGSRVDRVVTNDEAMFMPEFFMKGLSEAKKQNADFAQKTTVLLQGSVPENNSEKYIPLIVLSIICLLVFFISRIQSSWAKTTIAFVDSLLLYTTGLLGVLILFMWFGTDHTVCKNNFNIAWAFPLNFPIAFVAFRKRAWLSNYFLITAVITAILLATWFWLPQQLNIALLPVVILLLNRYVNLIDKYRRLSS
ncbi:MAG: DUF4105 domain-containing protein [Parafilimonas sp.]|nr:DUF4105 domain-containing protein [Parafilimonas sp.]